MIIKKTILSLLMFGSVTAQAQEYFFPEKDKGPLVVVLSGSSGPTRYQDLTSSIAKLGYSVLLVDGRDVPPDAGYAASNLKRYIFGSPMPLHHHFFGFLIKKVASKSHNPLPEKIFK